jgi:hypothetical protein
MDLLELAKAHIDAENRHDLELTMQTISEHGADYRVYATGEAFSSQEDMESFGIPTRYSARSC